MSNNTMSLNRQSRLLIHNIWLNARNHPMYASYQIIKDETKYSDGGAIAITISKGDRPMNMFLFYPACNDSGNIGSVAIYGSSLPGHKQAIEKTKKLFGLPVESVDWDEGVEIFLDVIIQDYSL